jgi:rhodanese-related sulfurtransferase
MEGQSVSPDNQIQPHQKATDAAVDLSLLESLAPVKSLLAGHKSELAQHCKQSVVFAGQKLSSVVSADEVFYLLSGDINIEDGQREERIKGRSSYLPINYLPRLFSLETCFAQTDCSLLVVKRHLLDQFLTWSQVAEYLMLDISYRPEYEDDQEWIATVLKSNLFYKVPPLNVGDIFSSLSARIVDKGEVILRQGELGDSCFFIKEGTATVERLYEGDSQRTHLADIGVGRCFGEDALLNATTRNATVTMTSHGVLMELRKEVFLKLLKEPAVSSIGSPADAPAECLWLDVRTSEEYAVGHIDQAANIPLNLLRLKQRMLDTSVPIVTYCDSGDRSRATAELLNRQGFSASYLASGLQGLTSDQLLSNWTLKDYVLVDGRSRSGQ